MQQFTQFQGFILIAGYAAIAFIITWLFSGKSDNTKAGYLVADRKIGVVPAAFSIAATWIWAPALFIASQKAYTQGWVGLFWFTVPNILCLVVFAFFADKVRKSTPEGFTLSSYMFERYQSKRVQGLYVFQMVGLAACSFAVQLLAGGLIISKLTGMSFPVVTIALSLIPIAYSWRTGIKASIVTDYFQMVIIAAVGLVAAPMIVANSGGLETVMRGLHGISGTYTGLFSGDGLLVFFSFGIPVTIGLMSGPFGDQSFWQRAFSVKASGVKRAFILGAVVFGIVPLMMSVFGFVAAGKGLQVQNSQLVNLEAVMAFLPFWVLIPFTYMILSGLVSTLDSNICSVASITGHDISEYSSDKVKASMVALTVSALLIANIPGMKILYLFLFYGTLRASTLLPTVLTVMGFKSSERSVFWGIVLAIIVFLPVFAIGKFSGDLNLILIGSIGAVLMPSLAMFVDILNRDFVKA